MHISNLNAWRLATRLAQEKQAVDNGTLDIVCGFMVIDEDSRTIVLEGASGPKGGLTALLRKVGRAGPNGQAYRALENPEVRFSRRLYTSFDADLKKVRVGGLNLRETVVLNYDTFSRWMACIVEQVFR